LNKIKPGFLSSEAKQTRVLLFDNDGFSDYTSYLARGLSRCHVITLYSFSEESCRITGALNEKSIKFVQIEKRLPKRRSAIGGIIRVFILFFIIFNALARTEYDVVHIQNYLPTFFLFIPLLKLRRKQITWTLHDLDLFSLWNNMYAEGINGRLQVLFQKIVTQPSFSAKYADKILVHAGSIRQQLMAKNVNQDKIEVIRHFDYQYLIDINGKNSIAVGNKFELGDNYILFFGNIAPWKGIDTLLDAFKVVKKRMGNKFILVIAGKAYSGFKDAQFFMSVRNEDRKYIKIINKYISGFEIPTLIRNSLFLVLPYHSIFQHCTSGVIPLAYTFAKPVIVSNVPSLMEYVENEKTGLIFNTHDSKQLADCITALVENRRKCIDMGQSAYQKLVNEMSLDICCKKIIQIYRSEI
jgi:alpha-maltose-1-phosphate synthase